MELKPDDVVDELGMWRTKEGDQVAITLEDLEVFVQQHQGDEVDEVVNCDSKFMLGIIPTIGDAIRNAYHWIPHAEKIYLVMDNGGHGTDIAIEQYTTTLKNDYNVEVVWQVPRSPETNMLDLGVWMSIQTAVTRVHHMRRCQHDALAKSVEDAWNSYLTPKAFENVHKRLRVVLSCIVEDKGGNTLVESKWGKLFRDATIIDLTEDDQQDDGIEVHALTMDDFDDIDDINDK